jgi:hypothetical protein
MGTEEPGKGIGGQISLDEAIDAWFDDSSRAEAERPRFVLVCGTPASGKTRLRHEKYRHGYVTVDAGDIFSRFPGSEALEFPGELEWLLDLVGAAVAKRAIEERRHIVTEVFELGTAEPKALLEAMRSAGYTTEVVGVRADVEQSVQWNMERSAGNVSSYYTDGFNLRWLTEAARGEKGLKGANMSESNNHE